MHDSLRVSEIIIELAGKKRAGSLNLLRLKKPSKVVIKKLYTKKTNIEILKDNAHKIVFEKILRMKKQKKSKQVKEKTPEQKAREAIKNIKKNI